MKKGLAILGEVFVIWGAVQVIERVGGRVVHRGGAYWIGIKKKEGSSDLGMGTSYLHRRGAELLQGLLFLKGASGMGWGDDRRNEQEEKKKRFHRKGASTPWVLSPYSCEKKSGTPTDLCNSLEEKIKKREKKKKKKQSQITVRWYEKDHANHNLPRLFEKREHKKHHKGGNKTKGIQTASSSPNARGIAELQQKRENQGKAEFAMELEGAINWG